MSLIEVLRIKRISLNQIISLVVLVVAGLVALNIYKGQYKKTAQIRQVQNDERKKNDILLRIGKLKKKIKSYKERAKPKERREIINTITNLAADNGAKIISLKPQDTPPAGMRTGTEIYNKVYFNLAIQVDGYHQLGKFISRLESNPMVFIIESLQLREALSARAELATRPEKLRVELIISKLFFE